MDLAVAYEGGVGGAVALVIRIPEPAIGSNGVDWSGECHAIVYRRVNLEMKALPRTSLLRKKLQYFPDTGVILWLDAPKSGRPKNGSVWGSVTSNVSSNSTKTYVMGKLGGTAYYAHRLIWRYMTGDDPGKMMIDHIDGNGQNNRWENLRLVTRGQNIANQNRQSPRKSPFKGVYKQKNRWKAQARRDGVLHTAPGSWETPEEAKCAYDELITKLDKK